MFCGKVHSGLYLIMPNRAVDLLVWWRGSYYSSKRVTLWKLIRSFVMWCISKEKNGGSFEEWEKIVSMAKCRMFSLEPFLLDHYPFFFNFNFIYSF